MDNPSTPQTIPPIKTAEELAAETAAAEIVAAEKLAAETAAAETPADVPKVDKPKTKPAAKTTPPPDSPAEVATDKTPLADKMIYAGVASVILGFILRSFL